MSQIGAQNLPVRVEMSQNLRDSIQRAISYAYEQSQRQVTLEHLLLALADDREAAVILEASSVNVTALITDVSGYLGGLDDRMPAGAPRQPAQSGEVQHIIQSAGAAAQKSQRNVVGSALVLAAIVGDGRSPAAQMLRNHGLTFENAIAALKQANAAAAARPVEPRPVSSPAASNAPQSRPVPNPDTPSTAPAGPSPTLSSPKQANSDARLQNVQAAHEIIASARQRIAAARGSIAAHRETAQQPPLNVQPSAPAPQQSSSAAEAPSSEVQGATRSEPSQSRSQQTAEPVAQSHPTSQTPNSQISTNGSGTQQSHAEQSGQWRSDAPARASGVADTEAAPTLELAKSLPPGAPQPAGQQAGDQGTRTAPPVSGGHMPTPQHRPGPDLQLAQATQPPIQPSAGHFPGQTGLERPGSGPAQMPPPGPAAQPPGVPTLQPGPQPDQPRDTTQQRMQPAPEPDHRHTDHGHRDQGHRAPQPQRPMPQPPNQAVRENTAPPSHAPHYDRSVATEPPSPTFRPPAASNATPIEPERLADDIPDRMCVGVSETVEVRAPRARLEAWSGGNHDTRSPDEHIITKAMVMRLKAPEGGFTIEVASPETQWSEGYMDPLSDDVVSWRWIVTPTKRGRYPLQLTASTRIVGRDGLAAARSLPEQVVNVRISRNFGRSAFRLAVWVAIALSGAALGYFGEALFSVGRSVLAQVMQ